MNGSNGPLFPDSAAGSYGMIAGVPVRRPHAYRKLLVNALVAGVQYLPGLGTNVAAGDRCGHAQARL